MRKISVLICCLIAGLSLVLTINNVQAGTITGEMGIFSTGWSAFQLNNNAINPTGGEDYVAADGKVGPGWGGQTFDAEYLFYKRVGNTLSLGLQTGFNVSGKLAGGTGADVTASTDGPVKVGGINYYAGDLALSFDAVPNPVMPGLPSDYEYAVDFGLYTEDYTGAAHGDKVGGAGSGIDAAGLYSVATWNNDVINPEFQASDPFAMETGTKIGDLSTNTWSKETLASGETSFARVVSFDLIDLGIGIEDDFTFFAHWTMSCGNDEINGYAAVPGNLGGTDPVPEPSTIALLGIGLTGLAGGVATRRIKKQKQR